MPGKEHTSQAKQSGAKVIAMHDEASTHESETLLQQAEAAEKNDDLDSAEKLYQQQLKQKGFNEFVYKRLMILYRKQKRYKEELDIINKGLKHFEEYRAAQLEKKNTKAIIKKLSNNLNRKLGLTNSKGKLLYEPDPIPAWKKRKETVEKKLKK